MFSDNSAVTRGDRMGVHILTVTDILDDIFWMAPRTPAESLEVILK